MMSIVRITGGRTGLLIVAVVLLAALGGCGDDDDDSRAGDGTVREELGNALPVNAPGQHLYLERVTISPGTQLDTHFHDGTQVAHIVSGSLTYNIVSGSAQITRDAGAVETLTGPTVTTLEPGDWIVETRDLVHFGSNESEDPVVVLLAVLLVQDAPLATPVED
jgi:quercetin dioxygenase-like cupin family protein